MFAKCLFGYIFYFSLDATQFFCSGLVEAQKPLGTGEENILVRL